MVADDVHDVLLVRFDVLHFFSRLCLWFFCVLIFRSTVFVQRMNEHWSSSFIYKHFLTPSLLLWRARSFKSNNFLSILDQMSHSVISMTYSCISLDYWNLSLQFSNLFPTTYTSVANLSFRMSCLSLPSGYQTRGSLNQHVFLNLFPVSFVALYPAHSLFQIIDLSKRLKRSVTLQIESIRKHLLSAKLSVVHLLRIFSSSDTWNLSEDTSRVTLILCPIIRPLDHTQLTTFSILCLHLQRNVFEVCTPVNFDNKTFYVSRRYVHPFPGSRWSDYDGDRYEGYDDSQNQFQLLLTSLSHSHCIK